ncbi:peptidoglycan-N-acetylglucosamine deacetylase [Oxobacter pfennigii]|uniref:Peptidoglycan-N-acetylglucosamine deacetylase n=1 Tax=Oxobacter pfennigii TaxID=36849 RepID=A0A0P8Z0H0_9CLOT|nr:polysaccharide deacetylase family protein [Oxobacter pfennigii]KPU45651.1 peptidoglycan-N-acetylglucosamine deacetylase [Oxobacter pfennigii]
MKRMLFFGLIVIFTCMGIGAEAVNNSNKEKERLLEVEDHIISEARDDKVPGASAQQVIEYENLVLHKAEKSNISNSEEPASAEAENTLHDSLIQKLYVKDGKKTAYLTFDDGPSKNITPKVLDILKKYDIKATFFIIGYLAEENSAILKRAEEEGHAIGNHSYDHNFKDIYKSVENFLQNVKRCDEALRKVLGESYKSRIFRFPGGSYKREKFMNALEKEGYKYIDWNSLSGDAEGNNIPADILVKRVIKESKNKEDIVVLMHDAGSKKTTVQALPQIIEYLKSQGYEFKTIE